MSTTGHFSYFYYYYIYIYFDSLPLLPCLDWSFKFYAFLGSSWKSERTVTHYTLITEQQVSVTFSKFFLSRGESSVNNYLLETSIFSLILVSKWQCFTPAVVMTPLQFVKIFKLLVSSSMNHVPSTFLCEAIRCLRLIDLGNSNIVIKNKNEGKQIWKNKCHGIWLFHE